MRGERVCDMESRDWEMMTWVNSMRILVRTSVMLTFLGLIDKYPGDALRVGEFAEAGNGTESLKE